MTILPHYLPVYYLSKSRFTLFILLLFISCTAAGASRPLPCTTVSKKAISADATNETIFYAATVRKDKMLHICAQGETIIYVFTVQDGTGQQTETVRRFTLNNVEWVYEAKRMATGGMLSVPVPAQPATGKGNNPARVGLILYEQSIQYDIMTGNNFDVPFSTLVIQNKSKRMDKVRFDQASVINNIADWSQKHHVRKTTASSW